MPPRGDSEQELRRRCSKWGVPIADGYGAPRISSGSICRRRCVRDKGANGLDAVTLARLPAKAGAQ